MLSTDSREPDGKDRPRGEFTHHILTRSLIAECHLEGENNENAQTAAVLEALTISDLLAGVMKKIPVDRETIVRRMIRSSRRLQSHMRQ